MKVVCESCQAKYQVPDERVAGKKLKIRCKRCGATVLIRGDLVQDARDRISVPAESMAPLESTAPLGDVANYEWHLSLDGDTRGPYDTDGVRAWLNSTPGGWDAHVWREGFPDWIEARNCAELDPPPPLPAVTSLQEDELPTQTFQAQSMEGVQFMAGMAAGSSRSTMRGQPSAIRSRAGSGISEPESPRITAAQSMMGERREDSVLFSQPGLQTMASGTAGYVPGPNPGFANGEGSGLIDIRALASLARQGTAQIAPVGVVGTRNTMATGTHPRADAALSFGTDEDARIALAGQPSAFARIDSLAPVSTPAQTSNVALPLAILGGCALVAAAVFAAILFTRPSRPAEMVSSPGASNVAQDSLAAAAEPPNEQDPELSAAEPGRGDSDPSRAAEPALSEEEELAAGKVKRQPHLPRTAVEEKKTTTTPDEKAKPKKEEKPEPQSSSGEVMLADRAKPVKPPVTVTPLGPAPDAPKVDPTKTTATPAPATSSDVDSMLGAKPPAKPGQPQKSRSLDDLLSGAVDKNAGPIVPTAKPAAPAATAAPGATPAAATADSPSDLPDAPSRDETLAAMRGVEAAVRACNSGAEALTGTAEVALTVSGTTGRVTTANVTGITGNVGSCIARAVRNARFPHFGKPTFSIKYPYRF